MYKIYFKQLVGIKNIILPKEKMTISARNVTCLANYVTLVP